ncbi:MAG: L-aspartate oxidase [Flavobacteriales bacterium]|nr:L-aspartate oxidase [Flavobacteriales bacterium]
MKRPLKVIVVGGGVAGMSFARRLSTLMGSGEVDIRMLSKAAPETSNSYAAQGGVAAVIHPSDSWEQHRDDTLSVGAGRCEADVVERVVREGPACIQELLSFGARFDTDTQGRLSAASEGGHRAPRVVHHSDHTGAEIVRVLQRQVHNTKNIAISETLMALDLLVTEEHGTRRCQGVRTVDIQSGVVRGYFADVVVLATGGAGQVYQHTTNPFGATGGGVAMAVRAGVPLRDMAFVQFHPTALYDPERKGTFLISEAVRGAGAVLLQPDGTRLMQGVHPMVDLAPRNVVARAIHTVMREQNAPHVWLDARSVGERFAQQFPMISAHCRSIGMDPVNEMIPVMPAAHYLCGGILTDAQGRTTMDGLYALGECASSGLHGADRLASNSLLEALVIPQYAAVSVMKTGMQHWLPRDLDTGPYADTGKDPTIEGLLDSLRNVMTDHVGIVRDHRGLRGALQELKCMVTDVDRAWSEGERSLAFLELRDLVTVAHAICEQAIAEPYNVGTHWNTDLVPFPRDHSDLVMDRATPAPVANTREP